MKLSLPGFPGNHQNRKNTSTEVMSSCVLQSMAMFTCMLLFLDQPAPSDTPQRCGGIRNCYYQRLHFNTECMDPKQQILNPAGRPYAQNRLFLQRWAPKAIPQDARRKPDPFLAPISHVP